MSRTNKSADVSLSPETSLAQKIKALRKALELNQKEFGQRCGGVSQVAVSQWESLENERNAVPTPAALVKMSELAPEAESQWWRDRAADQAGFLALNVENILTFSNALRSIPLIKSSKVATLGIVPLADVERHLPFPAECFPEGGDIRGVHVQTSKSLDLIALVDITRRDADRLLGQMIAVQTLSGIEVRWLGKDGDTYVLLPFSPGQQHRLLHRDGDYSIAGVVRWIGTSIAPVSPKKKQKS